MKQMTLATIKGVEVHGRAPDAQGCVSGAYGNACSVGFVLRADRTALPEGGEWTPAGGPGENASNVLGRQLVQPC